MDKTEFMKLAELFFDNHMAAPADGTLFNSEDAREKKIIPPFKMRKEITRVSTIAAHYCQPTAVLAEACKEIGIRLISGDKGGMVKRDDVNFLVQYIERRYNNYNE